MEHVVTWNFVIFTSSRDEEGLTVGGAASNMYVKQLSTSNA